jgi:hypothetical protein
VIPKVRPNLNCLHEQLRQNLVEGCRAQRLGDLDPSGSGTGQAKEWNVSTSTPLSLPISTDICAARGLLKQVRSVRKPAAAHLLAFSIARMVLPVPAPPATAARGTASMADIRETAAA